VGEKQDQSFQLSFNASLKVDYQGSRVTSDGAWEQLLPLEIERQQELGKEVVIRADDAFAQPEVYKAKVANAVSSMRSAFHSMRIWSETSPS